MAFAIFSLGTFGDVEPFVHIGTALQKRGEKVYFLSNDVFRDYIEGAGLRFVSVSTAEQYFRTYADPLTWTPAGVRDHFIQFHVPAIEPTFRAVEALVRERERPVLICQTHLNGARLACEKHGLEHAQIILSPSALPSSSSPSYPLRRQVPLRWRESVMPRIRAKLDTDLMERVIDPHVNPLREKLGLAPWSKSEVPREEDSECLVALFPEWLREVPSDWPGQLSFAGFPITRPDRHPSRHLVEAYVERYGRVLAFSFGTGVPIRCATVERAKHLCRVFDAPGLFVSQNVGDVLPHLEERFLCVGYVDFAHLFQRSRLVVHHGGIGTCARAMQAGVPQLISPFTFDQPDNAFWTHELGVANAVDFDRRALHDVIARMEFLLTDSGVRKHVRRVRRQLAGVDGAAAAAAHVLRHVRRRTRKGMP